MIRIFLLYLLYAPFSSSQTYPWLEQITRQERLISGCDKLDKSSRAFESSALNHILVDHQHKFLYCYVPKVACTNWKRLLMVLTNQSNATDLLDIPANLAHAENSTLRLSELPEVEARVALDHYTNFLIVRHPFERLLSAYRNKFNLTSTNYFRERYGKEIIRKYRKNPSAADLNSGANVSFREFVQFILHEGALTNEHWAPIVNLCLPCAVEYTFIGKYETLGDDSKTVLGMLGVKGREVPVTRSGHTKDKLRHYFQQLSIVEIQKLYKLYEMDFKLFGYGVEEMLGFSFG